MSEEPRKFPPWVLQDWLLTSSVLARLGNKTPTERPHLIPIEALEPLQLRLQAEIEDVRRRKKEIRDDLRKELATKREKARKKLWEELRAARRWRRRLRFEVELLQLQRARLQNDVDEAARLLGYLQSRRVGLEGGAPGSEGVPLPLVAASEKGEGLPEKSGIYFVWSSARVVYVGKSVNVNARARAGKHHAIKEGDELSWIEVPRTDLVAAEHWFIGLLRPERNRG